MGQLNYNPIEKGLPTIFVIGSPFQAMCAVEAIRDLEISDYVFYAVMGRNPRDEQIRSVLRFFDINYIELDKYKDIYPYKKRLFILKHIHNKYRRAFVGGYSSLHHYFMAMRSMSDKSVILTLDDGVETITLLRRSQLPKPKNKLNFINDILLYVAKKMRRISLRKHLYTIYHDIPSEEFVLYPNTFSHIYNGNIENSANCVYFAGATHEIFWKRMGMNENEYYDLLNRTFDWIEKEYPNFRKVYIPHGTDSSLKVKEICNSHHYDYIKPDNNIELFLCSQEVSPKAVFGFTSSCLLNIKKIFSFSDVMNVVVVNNGKIREEYKVISDYYEQNHIPMLMYIKEDGKLIDFVK